MSNRLYIGKVGALNRNDLYKAVSQFGNILDFMMKETYAFVVFKTKNSNLINIV